MPRYGGLGRRKEKEKEKEKNKNSNKENNVAKEASLEVSPHSHPFESQLTNSSNESGGITDNLNMKTFRCHYGGYFTFSHGRVYENGKVKVENIDIDYVSYFDVLATLKKECGFDIIRGDKFYYLNSSSTLNNFDALVQVHDDGDVYKMLHSYEKLGSKPIDIYTLLDKYDIQPNSAHEDFRNNDIGIMSDENVEEQEAEKNESASNNVKRKTRGPTRCMRLIALESGQKLPVEFDEDHQPVGDNSTDFVWFLGQTVRNRSCSPLQVKQWKDIGQDSIEHMWNIVLEKFTFEILDGRKEAIMGHMNALYRYYRHKMKRKYFDTKTTYQNRIKNKPKNVNVNDWKYLVNFWSEKTFQEKSMKNQQNNHKRSMPPYKGTKSFARLRHQMKKENGKEPSRLEVWVESRKRKNGKEVDHSSQNAIDHFDQLKKQREEGQIAMNDDQIFREVLGPEKSGYLRAYGPGKSITEYFGVRQSKFELMKQVEAARKETSEQVELAKKEANERVEEIKNQMEKQTDEKIAEMNRQWEERFKIIFASQVQHSSMNNQVSST